MNSKVFLILVVLVLAVSFVPDSDAFTAGGGGNIPRGAKREYAHQIAGRALCRAAREHCKRELTLADSE
ncbi:unnamed protein product [Porites evermanni]|uniref:Uncharacterized protein n=1 Tax=Porites evermanni TaxID=104178 RepID=A0ABN8MMN5_9CNID|nr:unnamed protein product [Porites evermanni]